MRAVTCARTITEFAVYVNSHAFRTVVDIYIYNRRTKRRCALLTNHEIFDVLVFINLFNIF